jgi:uncharacterized membrane protein YraQ (UPF0718 family)
LFAALAVPLVAVAVGTFLALAGGASPRVLVPVRSFALAAVLVAVLTHLLPEAIATIGPWAIAIFAAGFAAPQLFGWLASRGAHGSGKGHGRLATELGFIGVIVHQIGDGLALGAFRGHWDVVIAIGVHTIPLAAAVALGMLALYNRRAAINRAVLLAAATVIGVIITGAGGPMIASDVAPWINAAVAGLLVHVLSHDLPTPERTGTAPLVEVLAVAAGIVLPLLVAHSDGDADDVNLVSAIHEVLELVAVPLALALAGAILLDLFADKLRHRLIHHGPSGAIGAAAVASTCSCRAVPAARTFGHASPGTAIAFILAAPELALDTLLLGTQLLGLEAMVIRATTAVAVALVSGYVVDRLASHDHDHDHDHHDHEEHEEHAPAPSLLHRLDEVIIHSLPWIAVGVVLAAMILIALPPDALAGSPILYVTLAIALAIPTYICAPAATPIAAALIARGLPPGAAIAGLVVGAATNRAVLAYASHHGNRVLVAVIAIALAGAITASILVDRLAPSLAAPPLPYAGSLSIIALSLLGLALIRGLWRYGLASWLEPLHAGDHRHHQHPAGAPCSEGCHDH